MASCKLLHSIQVYWNTTAYILSETLDCMKTYNLVDDSFNIELTNLIKMARTCSESYDTVILNRELMSDYQNNDKLFYKELQSIIKNQQFLLLLQARVQDELFIGTRFFEYFLKIIGINK